MPSQKAESPEPPETTDRYGRSIPDPEPIPEPEPEPEPESDPAANQPAEPKTEPEPEPEPAQVLLHDAEGVSAISARIPAAGGTPAVIVHKGASYVWQSRDGKYREGISVHTI